MSEIVVGAPRPLTKQGFLKSAAAQSAQEYWGKSIGSAMVLGRLLRNWLSESPMSCAKFDIANLKFSADLSRLHQAMKHDRDTYRVTPFGLSLMVILRVPGAYKFTGHCARAYALLRKVYLGDPDNPSVAIDQFRAQLAVEELEFEQIFSILSDLSAGNLSTNVVDRRVVASPSIRNYADIWASLAALLPSFAVGVSPLQFSQDFDFERIKKPGHIGFENLLHPMIYEKIFPLYADGHYRDAVLNSVIVVFDLIRARTGLGQDGSALVGEALSLDRPRLILSELDTDSGRNDQKGFMQIIQGMYQGIRNPRAHSLDHTADEREAAQCMVFVSLVIQRIEDAVIVEYPRSRVVLV